MAYTVSQLKSDLTGILHGTTISKVTNLDNLINRAGRKVIAEIDPAETKKTANFESAIFDQVFDYTAPEDLKGNKVIDIRPQFNRTVLDNFSQRPSENFDIRKTQNTFHVRMNNSVRSIRLSKQITPSPSVIHTLDTITGNGTWAVGGDAENLTVDSLNFVAGSASLNFDLDGSGTTGFIQNSTMQQVDLTDLDEQGSVFVFIFLPDFTTITNVILRWGNDTSNFWSRTVTQPHDQTTFKTGFQLLRFDWNGATETGTVDPAKIDYLRVTITYDGVADTDFRVDNIVAQNGKIFEIEYYSKFLFRSSAGVFKEEQNNDTDLINLDTDSYNILTYECAFLSAQQLQGQDSSFDVNFFREELYGAGEGKPGLYKLYKRSNPSEAEKFQARYYRMPQRTYRTGNRRREF